MDRDIAQRLINLYNEYYEQIFMAAQRKGRDAVLRRDISAFFGGTTGLAELFRGLAFGDDGKLPREGILRNLDAIQASQKIDLLYQGLSELLDFVLFSAMMTVERHDEQGLERRVQAILAEAARGEGGEGRVASLPVGRQTSGAPIHVVDLRDPVTALTAPSLEEMLGPPVEAFAPSDSGEPMSSDRRTSVAIIPYLPDDEAYQLASGLRACRAEATFARERAEQIAQLAKSDELREAALRCCEHAASAIRALDQLDQLVQRLRRR